MPFKSIPVAVNGKFLLFLWMSSIPLRDIYIIYNTYMLYMYHIFTIHCEYKNRNKKSRLTDIENKLVATSGKREKGRGKIWKGGKEVQNFTYKISYKDLLYNTRDTGNIS